MPVADSWNYTYYYVLASKGIQDFILRGDKLKLMIGGSELVDDLPEKVVGEILTAMDLKEGEDFLVLSKAAGGVRLLFAGKEPAERFCELVPPAFSLYAPDLDFVQAVETIGSNLAETMDRAEKKLALRRSIMFPSYPSAGPLVERSPRSGQPSTGMIMVSGGNREEADNAMVIKFKAAEKARSAMALKTLPARDNNMHYRLPDSFEELTSKDNSTIAIVHIDGNGLGSVVTSLFKELSRLGNEKATEAYRKFCIAIQESTEQSVQEALTPIIQAHENSGGNRKPLPFRPLICAGDDVTIVLRAEDAIRFSVDFFESFEKHSEKKLLETGIEGLKNHLPLTACAGIAFVKKSFPFSQAYGLCESLCRFAKDRTGRKCSALAFWRLTSSMSDDFTGILERELTIRYSGENESRTVLTMMPYSAGTKAAGPRAEQLLELKEAVGRMPRGGLRSLLSDLFKGKKLAIQSFERLCDVNSEERTGRGGARQLDELLGALETITGNSKAQALFAGDATPLHDAVELISAERS